MNFMTTPTRNHGPLVTCGHCGGARFWAEAVPEPRGFWCLHCDVPVKTLEAAAEIEIFELETAKTPDGPFRPDWKRNTLMKIQTGGKIADKSKGKRK